jgi:hypothetical protein
MSIKIWWQGYSGMKLRDVKPKLQTMSSFEEAPDIIVLHLFLMGKDGYHLLPIVENMIILILDI